MAIMGYGGGGKGRLYTYRYTVTTRMTPTLRRAVISHKIKSHFNVSVGSDVQSLKTVSTNHVFFKRKESRSDIQPRSFHLPACCLTARPNWLTSAPPTLYPFKYSWQSLCLGKHFQPAAAKANKMSAFTYKNPRGCPTTLQTLLQRPHVIKLKC